MTASLVLIPFQNLVPCETFTPCFTIILVGFTLHNQSYINNDFTQQSGLLRKKHGLK